MQTPLRLLFILLSVIIIASGCSSTPSDTSQIPETTINSEQRTALLSQLTSWKVKGKIAFITPEERNSASLFWNKFPDGQTLNLTTYLGINVLKLTSNKNVHTIELDGSEYTESNLDNLITSLTNLTLPADALTFWIKALPYSSSDEVELSNNNLPKSITSFYNNRIWTIDYSHYNPLILLTKKDKVLVPHRIKVKSEDLTINIVIKNWTI